MIEGIRNLRDRGYPDSRTYNPSEETNYFTNALMTDAINTQLDRRTVLAKKRRPESELHKNLESAVKDYATFQKSHPRLPQLSFYDPTKNFEFGIPIDYTSGVIGTSPESGRKGFFVEKSSNGRTRKNYSAAINGLGSILGADSFQGSLPLPTGTLRAAYNGDVLYGNFEPTPFGYYYNALKTMLDRGEI